MHSMFLALMGACVKEEDVGAVEDLTVAFRMDGWMEMKVEM